MSAEEIDQSEVREHFVRIKVMNRTRAELIETVNRLNDRSHGENAATRGREEALLKRLKDMRKAKRLANARADKAVLAMRSMIENFQGDWT